MLLNSEQLIFFMSWENMNKERISIYLDKFIVEQNPDKRVFQAFCHKAVFEALQKSGVKGASQSIQSLKNKIYCGHMKRFMFLGDMKKQIGMTITSEQWKFQRDELIRQYNNDKENYPDFPEPPSTTHSPKHLKNAHDEV